MGLDQLIVNFTVKVKEIFQHIVVFSCTPQWQQEDIATIVQLVIKLHPSFTIKELNQGLDRESYRLAANEADYWLHFECYSQSIWLEPLSEVANNPVETLFAHLKEAQDTNE